MPGAGAIVYTAASFEDNTIKLNKTYSYQLRVYNILDPTENSMWVTASGTVNTQIPAPASISATQPDLTNDQVTWNAVTISGYTAKYLVQSRLSTDEGTSWGAWSSSPIYDGTALTTTVARTLNNPWYQYQYRVLVYADGEPEVSNWTVSVAKQFVVLETTFKAPNVVGSTVTLKWNLREGATGYRIKRYANDEVTLQNTINITNGATTQTNDTGLGLGTTYKYTIEVEKGGIYSDPSGFYPVPVN